MPVTLRRPRHAPGRTGPRRHPHRLRTLRQDTRWHNARRDLFNRVWSADGLTTEHLPGATPAEQAAYRAGQAAALSVDLAAWGDPPSRHGHLPELEAARITALLIEFTRAYPRTLAYPGRVLEIAWPVLAGAHRQGLIPGVRDDDHLRPVTATAAAAVSAALRGPAASWWSTDTGEWLWTSATRSLTTGRVWRTPAEAAAQGGQVR